MGDNPTEMKPVKINKKDSRVHNSFEPLENFCNEKPKKNPSKKYKWVDSITGHSLSAGGILFYDDTGIWVVGEKDHGEIVYSDIGGKYEYEDGNIWTTIRRELYEETYGCCEIVSQDIISLSQKYPPVYVNGHKKLPVYACLVVPITETLSFPNFTLDPEIFTERRSKTLIENSDVPVDYYPCVLTKLTYKSLKTQPKLSYRLQRILRFSSILNGKIQSAKN